MKFKDMLKYILIFFGAVFLIIIFLDKDICLTIFYFLLAVSALIAPIFFTVINLCRLISDKRFNKTIFDVLTLIIGGFLTMCFISIAGEKEYNQAIILGEVQKYHTPISGRFFLSFCIIAIVGGICEIILSIPKRKPPLVSAFAISGVFIGNVLSLAFCIQLCKHFSYDLVFVLYILPVNFLLMSIRVIKNEVKRQIEFLSVNQTKPKNKFIGKIYNFLKKSINWYLLGFILLIPFIAILLLILVLFGQGADGIIKAFTMTADWTFSTQIPPPPIDAGRHGHYLCTVAARGHEKLVRPTRMGIRNGKKIVVNRQLCIANAFEDLIAEKTPKFHKAIRAFYDKYGYPLSKKITTKTMADIVYIIMKPLEWIFLLVLYTFDISPENRIAIQYTGKNKNDF